MTVPENSAESYPVILKGMNAVQDLLRYDSVCVSKNGDVFEISELSADSRLVLLHPLELTVYFDDGLYIVENDVFEIFSFDKSFKNALHDLEIQFYDLWEDFVSVDESCLAPSGIILKKLLQKYLGEKNDTKNIQSF
ncbi:hypothetical protein [Methanimicrococcus hongohii]|uniref:hypothetical protein n=1 Tax=Methanimicrococcus hongohii TaxID=3028295 RepID=UPI002930DAEF|nr:hypothetical protein [Methanimicrococcus sp. Hf6]